MKRKVGKVVQKNLQIKEVRGSSYSSQNNYLIIPQQRNAAYKSIAHNIDFEQFLSITA
jgi:hypothetical protein